MFRLSSTFFKKAAFGSALAGAGAALIYNNTANASSDALEPPHYPWSHRFPWQSFDHAR
jgi:hypothetical protein